MKATVDKPYGTRTLGDYLELEEHNNERIEHFTWGGFSCGYREL